MKKNTSHFTEVVSVMSHPSDCRAGPVLSLCLKGWVTFWQAEISDKLLFLTFLSERRLLHSHCLVLQSTGLVMDKPLKA